MRNGSTNMDVLEEFVYLAETQNYRKTADHFYVSKSVISRHIAALEELLGVKLFERSGRGVRLTGAGDEFYRETRTVLRDWRRAVDRAREAEGRYSQVVRIGYLRNAARPVLVRFVRYMADRYPDTKLSLTCLEYNELRRALREGDVDVALAINVNPSISRNYRSTRIYDDSFYAVCSKEHTLASREGGVPVEALVNQNLLLPDIYVYGGLAELIEGLIDEKALLAAREYYRDIDMLYLKVQTEDCVAFSSGMNNAMFGDRVAQLPVTGINTSFSVSAFYREGFTGPAFEACCDGFEWSRDALKGWEPDIRLEFYGQ